MKKDNSIQDQQLLAEIEDIIRTRPSRATLRHEKSENLIWFGRATAAIAQWNSMKGISAQSYSEGFFSSNMAHVAGSNLPKFEMLLYQAQHDLRMRTIGPANIAIGQGEVFRYFDALRGLVEMAASDLLFVDRYMGPDFISTYMALVKPGVTVRLLSREKIAALVAAASKFSKQHGTPIEIRESRNFHDRWLFVDKTQCYLSGASFKDGGKQDATTLTQHVDIFPAVRAHHEQLWQVGTPHPLLP